MRPQCEFVDTDFACDVSAGFVKCTPSLPLIAASLIGATGMASLMLSVAPYSEISPGYII